MTSLKVWPSVKASRMSAQSRGGGHDAYGGYHQQLDRLLRTANVRPRITEWAKPIDMLITLISAGHGVAIASASRLAACRHHNTVVRPLDTPRPTLLTYLLHHESLDSVAATDFIDRMRNQRWSEEAYGRTIQDIGMSIIRCLSCSGRMLIASA